MADRLSLFPTLIFASVDINIAETFLCPFHTFLSHENKLGICIWDSEAVDRPCVHSECWLLCTTNFHCVQFFRQNPLKLHSIEFAWFNKLHVFKVFKFSKLACPVRRVTNWIGAVYKRLLELFYLLRIWNFDFVLGVKGLFFSKLYCLLFSCHCYQNIDGWCFCVSNKTQIKIVSFQVTFKKCHVL